MAFGRAIGLGCRRWRLKPRVNWARVQWLKEHDPEGYRQVVADLEELDRQFEANPLAFYRPHAKQGVFHEARTHVKAFLGGNQSGKTTAGVADDLLQAVDAECLPDRLKPFKRFDPPFLGRIVTPDFTSTMEGVVFEKLKALAPKAQLLGGGWDSAYDKQLRKLRFANGSWLDFLTYEQDLDKFGGATLDRVHFDEEPPGEKGRKIYLQSRVRVMARGGDLVFTMTPELGMSWMFDEVFERRLEDDVTVVQVATDENVFLPAEQVEEAYSRMSDEEQQAKRKGLFVHFGGLVVNIDRGRHVVSAPSPQHVRGLQNYVVIDPGAAQGAVLFGGFDRDDVLLAWDELYPSGAGALVENVVGSIDERLNAWGLTREDVTFVIDPSARNRTVDGGLGVEVAFWQRGIYPIHGKNHRKGSILQLRGRVGADVPAVLISEDCRKLVWELGRWRVAEDENTDRVKRGQTGDSFATEGPDHLADCLRYLAMERLWGPLFQPQRAAYQPWVADRAPSQEWFDRHAPVESAPMGLYS